MSKSPEGGLRSLSGTELTMPFKIEHIPDSLKEETQEHLSRSMEFFNKVNKEFQKLQEQLQQVTQQRDALRQQNNCLQQQLEQLEQASSEQMAVKPVVLSQFSPQDEVNGIDFHEGQQENASRTSRVACRRFLAIALQSAVVCGLSNRLTRKMLPPRQKKTGRREATQQVVLQQPCRRRITVRRRQNRRRHRRR
ncbi:unnamed protein product [Symbiodinium sp. CCMP2592]|nr:unnamed protein product [Symbiodinium sp. CCMP2592]